jgi:hypothetical protein
MSTVIEALPLHPRKASASRRRRHQARLQHRLDQIVPGAATILITPLWTDGTGHSERHFLARALTGDGKALKFEAGGSRQITALMQGAYPSVNWDHPQTWDVANGRLVDRISKAVS